MAANGGFANANGGFATANGGFATAALRTQVSELELVNGLYKGRVLELERVVEAQRALERELRGRLAALEREVWALRGEAPRTGEGKMASGGKRRFVEDEEEARSEGGRESLGSSPHGAKRSRRSDVSEGSERKEVAVAVAVAVAEVKGEGEAA